MINGCVKGQDDCGCDCHRVPGVVHIRPCCDKPPAPRRRVEDTLLEILQDPDYLTSRDTGDESTSK